MSITFYSKFILGNCFYFGWSTDSGSIFNLIYFSLACKSLPYVSTSLNLRLICFSVISLLSLNLIYRWICFLTYEFLLFFQVLEYFSEFLRILHTNPNYCTSHFPFSLPGFYSLHFHNLFASCIVPTRFQMRYSKFLQLILLLAELTLSSLRFILLMWTYFWNWNSFFSRILIYMQIRIQIRNLALSFLIIWYIINLET